MIIYYQVNIKALISRFLILLRNDAFHRSQNSSLPESVAVGIDAEDEVEESVLV